MWTFLTIIVLVLAHVTSAGDMALVSLPESTTPGGRCMDGSMAGYYIRGSNPDLFVIYLNGGGKCKNQKQCDARAGTHLGSSDGWSDSLIGTTLLDGDCDNNPDFCDATAVYIPYCTGDGHLGSVTEPSAASWGYYFDGHTNFVAIIEKLIQENGLGNAQEVLLTGRSAGAVGTLFNVDWLAEKLTPNIVVKAVAVAGWYFPAALPTDLESIFSPSDFPHFEEGVHGNDFFDAYDVTQPVEDIYKIKELLPADCLAAYPEKWWVCQSIHQAYPYIKTPLFNVHTQFDYQQIFTESKVPKDPTKQDLVEEYIGLYGQATRISLQKILDDTNSNGLFSASCILHGTPELLTIQGKKWMEIVHDWFFENGLLENYYRLVETCYGLPNTKRTVPCNPYKTCGAREFTTAPSAPPAVLECAAQVYGTGCMQSYTERNGCLQCAQENSAALAQAGCTSTIVSHLCIFTESHDIDKCFDDDVVDAQCV